MEHNIFWTVVLSSLLMACQSVPVPKAVSPPTMATTPAGGEEGKDEGGALQNAVEAIEDKVYGSRKLGTLGLYGELKSCRRKLASPQFGGEGSMIWSEPLDRLTDKEDEFKSGRVEKGAKGALSRERSTGEDSPEHVRRFQNYRMILQKRSEDYSRKIEACKAELAAKEMDPGQSNGVAVSEAQKSSLERAEINKYVCGWVQPGASLQAFMLNAFAEGWLSLGDYPLGTNLIAVSLKDAKGKAKDNAFLFNGWRLAFDRGSVTVGEILNGTNEARLLAWAFDRKADVPDSAACLSSRDGQWNPP